MDLKNMLYLRNIRSSSILLTLGATILSVLFIVQSVSLWKVYQNVHRKAYASVRVGLDGIFLSDVKDPYKILTSSRPAVVFNNLQADGSFRIDATSTKYDFTVATLNASITSSETPGIMTFNVSENRVNFVPITMDGNFTDFTSNLPYTFDLSLEMQQPA